MLKVPFRPRVRWLIHLSIVGVALLISSPRALAGVSRIDGPGMMNIECEYLLSGPSEYVGARKWFMQAVAKIQGPDDIYLADIPTESAFQALGLPTPLPKGSKLQLRVPTRDEGVFAARILAANGEELAKYTFHFPPYLAWKRVSYSDYTLDPDESTLKFDLSKEDPTSISVGALIGDFPGGRRFLSVRVHQANLVTVVLGVDVRNFREYRRYSGAREPRILGGSDEAVYSRVEVIKAHFRVQAPPPLQRGLGSMN